MSGSTGSRQVNGLSGRPPPLMEAHPRLGK